MQLQDIKVVLPTSAPLCSKLSSTQFLLCPKLQPTMSDIEKLDASQSRSQIANPAPLYVVPVLTLSMKLISSRG